MLQIIGVLGQQFLIVGHHPPDDSPGVPLVIFAKRKPTLGRRVHHLRKGDENTITLIRVTLFREHFSKTPSPIRLTKDRFHIQLRGFLRCERVVQRRHKFRNEPIGVECLLMHFDIELRGDGNIDEVIHIEDLIHHREQCIEIEEFDHSIQSILCQEIEQRIRLFGKQVQLELRCCNHVLAQRLELHLCR